LVFVVERSFILMGTMAQRQNAQEQYTVPEPMRVELKNQSNAFKVSRLVFVPHPLLLSLKKSYRFAYLEIRSLI